MWLREDKDVLVNAMVLCASSAYLEVKEDSLLNALKELNSIKQQLSLNGYKLTRQREDILSVFLEHEDAPLNAEELYLLVKRKNSSIGLATVYRALELFTELNIVAKLDFENGVTRFDIRHEQQKHMSHHLICYLCGNLQKIKEDWLEQLEKRLEQEYGFRVLDHRLDFVGTYRSCQNNKRCQFEDKEVS